MDPAIERSIAALDPAPAKPAHPIRKLVLESKVKLASGSESTTTFECEYEGAGHGVFLKTCERRGEGANQIATSELVFMGLTAPLASSSGLKGLLTFRAVTRAFMVEWTKPYRVDNRSVLTRWDAEFTKIAHPAPGLEWTDSYSSERSSASTATGNSTRAVLELTRRCVIGERSPATAMHRQLTGDALKVECAGNGSAQVSQSWVFLGDAGLYVLLHTRSAAVETRTRILEVKHD